MTTPASATDHRMTIAASATDHSVTTPAGATDHSVTIVDGREPEYHSVKSIVTRKPVQLKQLPVQACSGDRVHIEMDIDLEDGLHLTEGAPSVFQIVAKGKWTMSSFVFGISILLKLKFLFVIPAEHGSIR